MNITTVKQARQFLTSKGFYVKGFRWYDMERKCTGQGYHVYDFYGRLHYDGGLKHHGKAEFIQWVNLNS